MRIAFFLSALSLALSACAPKPTAQAPCNFVLNSDVQRVSWKSIRPITMYIDSSLPAAYHDSVRSAASTWNTKLNKTMFVVVDNVATPPYGQDGKSVLYWVTDWPSDQSATQAKTTIFWQDTQILEADVRVNGHDYDYSGADTLPPNKVDFDSLILHEFGHALGLVHIIDNTSVMEPSLAYGQDRRTPGPVDLTSLACEY